jgi:hypothetical protein
MIDIDEAFRALCPIGLPPQVPAAGRELAYLQTWGLPTS